MIVYHVYFHCGRVEMCSWRRFKDIW